jgi:predicted TIM-barrel fold metal-dependent hydrolase
MLIVDSQVHLWGPGAIPAPPSHHRQLPSFSSEQLIAEMKEAGVDRAIIVPPNWNDRTAENDYALEQVRPHLDRLAVMGPFVFENPEHKHSVLDWRKQPGRLGMRLVFLGDRTKTLRDGTADWLWAAAERHTIPIMIYAPSSISVFDTIAERHPGLRLIIDHFGANVAMHGTPAFAQFPELLALSRHKNVAVKVSGAPSLSDDTYPFRDLDKYLRQIFEMFGPDRMLWGSDLTRMPCSYRQCVTHFTQELSWLSEADRTKIMGTSACNWMNWPAGR